MKALITGISGQDGSYLAELLLDKGYEVWGIIRRNSSSEGHWRIEHIKDQLNLRYGDVTDKASLYKVINECKPEEIYNLAAMSHVGLSFKMPEYTFDVNAKGTINLLEVMKELVPESKFYNATTSEMFGTLPAPQDENTPFHPRSPYGVAKLASYWSAVNYRESFGMHCSNGILFNHECFDANTPIIIMKNNLIDICYIRNLLPERTDISKENRVLSREIKDIKVWNGECFVDVKAATRRKINTLDKCHQRKITYNTRRGAVKITPNHKLITNDFTRKSAKEMAIGDKLKHGEFPRVKPVTAMLLEEAELYGMLTGDGYISSSGETMRFINNDKDLIDRFIHLSKTLFGNIKYKIKQNYETEYGNSSHVDLQGVSRHRKNLIRTEIYEKKSKHKKIPLRILNADYEVKMSFLRGYYSCDGLKKDKCTYEFKSLKSNSPLLCQGLLLLINELTGQTYNINVFSQNNNEYYQVNLHSPQSGNGGKHLTKDPIELKKNSLTDMNRECFVYDIETECGYLNAGVGSMIVGNSPRRGDNFVTKKITKAVARIQLGLQSHVELGNLDALRDWGYAPEYCEAMIKMLQQEEPDDYVIATGAAFKVRDFLQYAFDAVGLKVQSNGFEGDKEIWITKETNQIVVRINPEFYRPSEVFYLCGSPLKAKKKLKWKAKTKLKDLVKKMVKYDLEKEVRIIREIGDKNV